MAYSSACQVLALIPNIVGGASVYEDLTVPYPASEALVNWQSAGCALIEGRLSAEGYSVPVAATNRFYDYIGDLEATYVAYRAERAKSSPRLATGERGRAEQFKRDFDAGLDDLCAMDLARMGFSFTSQWYVGGISQSEKDSVTSDTDRVPNIFKKGQFDNRGVSPPDGTTLDDDQAR